MNELEIDLYLVLKKRILEEKNNIFQMSDFIAQLDIANMTADQKLFNNYNIPIIVDGSKLVIKNGRHPVVEDTFTLASDYTPNDCELNDGNIWLITVQYGRKINIFKTKCNNYNIGTNWFLYQLKKLN